MVTIDAKEQQAEGVIWKRKLHKYIKVVWKSSGSVYDAVLSIDV
jgi:hypothetical protein